jgi:hypothetical protein
VRSRAARGAVCPSHEGDVRDGGQRHVRGAQDLRIGAGLEDDHRRAGAAWQVGLVAEAEAGGDRRQGLQDAWRLEDELAAGRSSRVRHLDRQHEPGLGRDAVGRELRHERPQRHAHPGHRRASRPADEARTPARDDELVCVERPGHDGDLIGARIDPALRLLAAQPYSVRGARVRVVVWRVGVVVCMGRIRVVCIGRVRVVVGRVRVVCIGRVRVVVCTGRVRVGCVRVPVRVVLVRVDGRGARRVVHAGRGQRDGAARALDPVAGLRVAVGRGVELDAEQIQRFRGGRRRGDLARALGRRGVGLTTPT